MLKGGLAAQKDIKGEVPVVERRPLGIGMEAGGVHAEGLGRCMVVLC